MLNASESFLYVTSPKHFEGSSCLIPSCTFFFFFFPFSWLHHVACGILVPQPGIEPVPSAVKAQNPNHWTARLT